jgi:hypothetical protein
MFIPNNIQEFLDERIEFCENHIKRASVGGEVNHILLSDFYKALVHFEYCKKLYLLLCTNKDDAENKARFKRAMATAISDILFAMKQQEERCYYGIPTGEKSYLPQESKDNSSQLIIALNKIQNQVNAY